MKAGLLLLCATVVPLGWLILGAILLWRLLLLRNAAPVPASYSLQAVRQGSRRIGVVLMA